MDENITSKPLSNGGLPYDVLIFGSGPCARKISTNLAAHGIHSLLVIEDDETSEPMVREGLNFLPHARLKRCMGFAPDFKIDLIQGSEIVRKKAGVIVVAQDQVTSPNYEPYGLSFHKRILDISRLEEMMRAGESPSLFGEGSRIVFLCGWHIDSHPAVARRMLRCCLRLQRQSNISTVFMTGNLKVSADGAEALHHRAKKYGTVFIKSTDTFPEIQILDSGGFSISYMDDLARMPFQMNAHWIVVDETIGADPGLKATAKKLNIVTDHQGFAQNANVHRLSNDTNRRGIFVAGGARGMLSREEKMADADQVALKVLSYLKNTEDGGLPKVEIHRGRCARCLTCHRLCPHHAIDIGQRISIVHQACQSCGICFAGCPARAIDFDGLHISTDLKRWQPIPNGENKEESGSPNIVVFGCSRSAGQAHRLSQLMGCAMPSGVRFLEVPCGGSISSRHLLAAFEAGAHGVMLLTCHEDNCHSDTGNKLASKRAKTAAQVLNAAGVEGQRLKISTLAANMGDAFFSMVNEFVDLIKALKLKE